MIVRATAPTPTEPDYADQLLTLVGESAPTPVAAPFVEVAMTPAHAALGRAIDANRRRALAEASQWLERARAAVITNRETYKGAADLIKGIKDLRLRIADTFDSHIERAHQAHKALLAEKKQAEAPLIEAEKIIKAALVAWEREQERIRQAEQARLDALARAEEEARRLEEAAALERVGHATGDADLVEAAESIMAAPVNVAAPVVKSDLPRVDGISYSTTYSARVTSLIDLVRFIAANPTHIGLIAPSQPALNALARAAKGSQSLIPGVVFETERGVAIGQGRL